MKLKRILITVLSLIVSLIVLFGVYINNELGPVTKDSNPISLIIENGSTYLTLTKILKNENLIKSELFYKLYIKLTNPKSLEAGKYELNTNMDVKTLVQTLSNGGTNPDIVTVTIPEGKTIEEVASLVETATNNKKEDLLDVWDDKTFINEVIEKYWFVTEEVLQKGIRHPLEGYLFPSTYELTNKDVTPEYIAYRMLDEMDKVLTPYKEDFIDSYYTVHDVLTMASIVEYEAILDEDRPLVAGVFYNRLSKGMKLQSCATLGYAIDEWKLTYTYTDMNTKSPYNTYYYTGLPIGPGGMPSKESIIAAINPTNHDYYYFMANVCDVTSKKTYFSKTYSEHQAKVEEYLTCF